MKSLYDLFIKIVGGETATTLISDKKESERGHICEAILRLTVGLHIHPKNGDYVDALIPDPKYQTLTTIKNVEDYLNTSKINNSCETGKIDAAWIQNSRIILASSKIKNYISSLDELDVTYLSDCVHVQKYTLNGNHIDANTVDLCVIVLKKDDIIKKIKNANTNDMKNRLNYENIYDIDDLDRMCFTIQKRTTDSLNPLESLIGDTKKNIDLRFHQSMIYKNANKILEKLGARILIGAIPRSGKTYIGAKLCVGYSKILVITTRPSETRSSWLEVFKNHREFTGYSIKSLNSETEELMDSSAGKMIVVASTQFFKNNEKRQLKKNKSWDIILVDEIHEGGTTISSMNILQNNSSDDTRQIMMTATYEKPIIHYNIPKQNQFYWDLEDVRLMKNWGPQSISRMVEKYGSGVHDTIREFESHKKNIADDYIKFPEPVILTTTMQQDYYKDILDFNKSQDLEEAGFSMRALLMTTKDGGDFQNPTAVKRFLELISGSKMEKGRTMSMLHRTRRVWSMKNHRPDNKFMTMLWFLPFGIGQKLDDVKACLKKYIQANPILKKYAVMTLDSGNNGNLPTLVGNEVSTAKNHDMDGLIILTGDVGGLGVSLPSVDIVFMMNHIESSDKNFQHLTRCLTEDKGKTCGVIVDFNVWRVLNTLSTYANGRCEKVFSSTVDKLRWCITNLVNVDVDLWDCPESPVSHNQDSIVEKMSIQWTRMMENAGYKLSTLQKQFADIGDDQAEINRFSKFTASSGKADKNSKEDHPDGISETRSDDESVKSDKKKDTPKNININEILARLIPEVALLSGGTLSLVDSLKFIGKDEKLRSVMNSFLEGMST
jgi:hypothetical protein